MNTSELLRHLRKHQCELLRDQGKHSIWWNPASGHRVAIPRHRTVYREIARKVCKQLEIPLPSGL